MLRSWVRRLYWISPGYPSQLQKEISRAAGVGALQDLFA